MHPLGQSTLKKLGDPDTHRNIEASISSDLVPFGELASLMQIAADEGRKFTIHEWLKKPSILVFSGTSNPQVPLAYLNRTFLTELIEFLVREPDTRTEMTWIFLDEAASLGRQTQLPTLMRECRSKGASVFMGIQDVSGFRAALGDKDEAESVLSQIKNRAYFKLPDKVSAEWASAECGETRRIDPAHRNVKIERRFPFTYFQDQNKFNEHRGLPGVFRTGHHFPVRCITHPPLFKEVYDPDAWPGLGSVSWPGTAKPRPNLALESFLGTSVTQRQLRPTGQPPTTGRILPDNKGQLS